MTTTPTDAPQEPGPGTPPGPAPRNLGALRRSRTDRRIAGVAGGLAQHLRVDPIIVRVALVVLVFFGGAGLVLYIGAWLFVPEEGERSAIIRLDARSRAFVLYVVAALAAAALLGDTAGHLHAPWPVLIVVVVALLIIAERRGELRMPGGRRQSPPADHEPAPASASAEQTAAAPTIAPEPAPPTAASASTAATGTASPASPASTSSTSSATTYQAPDQPFAIPPADPGAPIRSTLPANPRRRGPILFWFTLALIALAEGIVGIVDVAGASIAGPVYPAVAVAIIGIMLVLGAFWGRAGGLILIGFVASVVLAGSLAADKWGLDRPRDSVTYSPATSSAVQDSYRMGTGELTVDLSHVSDPAGLAGRTIDISGHVGRLEIIVPAGLPASADAVVKGPGQVDVFGDGHGGIDSRLARSVNDTLAGAPLTITAELNVGHITVETSDE
jgi:phage shock protein PspC (stress-responsive transcriptional regulator)